MIVFDLRCGGGHVFEAWFASSDAYAEQRGSGRIRCPLCDSEDVSKAVMAPRVGAKSNRAAPAGEEGGAKQTLAKLAAMQAEMLKSSEWVGRSFAHRARAMHEGREEHAPIHGQASLAEAKALAEDGVPVAPLPLPVTPPDQLN